MISLHLITYVWLDKFFDFVDILRDIGKRPFITARRFLPSRDRQGAVVNA